MSLWFSASAVSPALKADWLLSDTAAAWLGAIGRLGASDRDPRRCDDDDVVVEDVRDRHVSELDGEGGGVGFVVDAQESVTGTSGAGVIAGLGCSVRSLCPS
jgi:hypothetical protein